MENSQNDLKMLVLTRLKRLKIDISTLTENDIFTIIKKLENGTCEICGKRKELKDLCIDHDHKTGKVRGVVCRRCNYFMGIVHDNGLLLGQMSDYLKRDDPLFIQSSGSSLVQGTHARV